MTGVDSIDGLGKNRSVLGDVTNQVGKRGFELISGNRGVKSGDGYGENVDEKVGDSDFAKRVCQGVENLEGQPRARCGFTREENDLSLSKSKKSTLISKSKKSTLISKIPKEIREPSNVLDNSIDIVRDVVLVPSDKEVGNASRDSCASSGSLPTGSEPSESECYGVGENFQDYDQIISPRKSAVVDNLTSVHMSRLAKSQGSKSFELERCSGLKNDACYDMNADADMLKACSCPFCLKAAYIWSDLHYQDIKGRIAALKKSQKEASVLVQRSCRTKETDAHVHVNPNKTTKLESELMNQWRTLFLNMGNILARESSQLQTSFLTLKDLRESCKNNLEMTNGMPSDRQ